MSVRSAEIQSAPVPPRGSAIASQASSTLRPRTASASPRRTCQRTAFRRSGPARRLTTVPITCTVAGTNPSSVWRGGAARPVPAPPHSRAKNATMPARRNGEQTSDGNMGNRSRGAGPS